ncbi:MAG: PAS domain-containing protein [Acidobacteria bacterium]|nr:PAS domain-containing protein [Acidobacteriota bacterium]
MAQRDRPLNAAQAGAHLAVARSTLGIVLRAILVMLAAEFLGSLTIPVLGIPYGVSYEIIEALLSIAIALPVLYATTHRPLSELAARHAAASAEARFQAIAHAAGDAIVILDANWKVHFANRATEKMFGLGPRAWETLSIESVLSEESKPFLLDAHRRFLETGERVLSSMGTIELVLLRNDGGRFPAEVRVSELREHNESLFVAVLRA